MRLWHWLVALARRRWVPVVVRPPVTPPEEHAEAQRRVADLQRRAAEAEARARAVQVQADLAARRPPRRGPEPGR